MLSGKTFMINQKKSNNILKRMKIKNNKSFKITSTFLEKLYSWHLSNNHNLVLNKTKENMLTCIASI